VVEVGGGRGRDDVPEAGSAGDRSDEGGRDDEDLELADDHVYLGDLEDESDHADAADTELDTGADVHRAPICGACGVTALPADPANVLDTDFVCDNEGCVAFGEVLG
jgi:hypothetical protein